MKLITIIIGLFAFQISNASAINLLLDCKGKGGDKNSAVGRTGKVKLKTESLPPQNMMFKIENN